MKKAVVEIKNVGNASCGLVGFNEVFPCVAFDCEGAVLWVGSWSNNEGLHDITWAPKISEKKIEDGLKLSDELEFKLVNQA